MSNNPILEEIYAARAALLAACNGDLRTCVEEARKRALASGHKIAAPKRQDKSRAASAESCSTASGILKGTHQTR